MNAFARRRARRLLPAYHTGRLAERDRAWLERCLVADAELGAESAAVAEIGRRLLAGDPAGPPDAAAGEALRRRLRAELAGPPRRAAVSGRRPALALGGAAALFAVGCLTGALAFPRTVTQEVVREVVREVPVVERVEVVKPVVVEKPVTVRVPVERVVTRWRTRTVYRTLRQSRPQPARTREVGPPAPPRPAVPTVEIDPQPQRSGIGLAALPDGARPAAVDF